MGVESVTVIVDGSAAPTLGTRVPLGLSVIQKARLKGAYFSRIEFAQGTFTWDNSLSEDLRVLTVGVVAAPVASRRIFFIVRFHQILATDVGFTNGWLTFKADLWDYEVYQDIVYIPDVTASANRLDLFYEKMPVDKLEKAAHLDQLKRQFTVA